eukprot:615649-Prymnesium_polylepis.1
MGLGVRLSDDELTQVISVMISAMMSAMLSVMMGLGVRLSDDELTQAHADLDSNGDGTVSLQ